MRIRSNRLYCLFMAKWIQNSGTFPRQSERLFDAIQGLGGKARLVILPFEGHSYTAKESIEHLLFEQSLFLKANLQPK